MNYNYSILQQNILNSLDNEESQKTFMKLTEHKEDDLHHYFAERIAREVEQLCDFLKPSIDFAAETLYNQQSIKNESAQGDLLDFILKRHWHWRNL